ncbi:serine/threonine-protein kinase [Streptomyces acidicola]|uniref:non-specific serine/threonine protein kinase n=1 Tax=Streptomyces acidicola TaxID=2596892 RepID=A0A5N8X656_9ACTN|nr:serine/threonine-protein kinase [Streptomyces acidicola]MPY54584.1 protein kinase [Streptomyces acidicola]
MTSEDTGSEESGRTRVIADRYTLLSPLGEGGMGTVWRAHDKVLHRKVAIKEVRAPAGLATAAIERMYTRLEREAWAAARVSHRNVVTVYDVAMEEGRPWIVMELVQGQSLADLLKAEGPLTPQLAASIGGEVLAALRAAHEAGVLHRDVKPANVLMAKDGRVVLTDFGIAEVEGNTALTMTGEVVGSPEFLAPERALGKRPGFASDLWSLGVLLYASVEGISPFRQNTALSTLRAIVDTELPPPRRAGALTPVIEGLLLKDPDERLGAEPAARELQLVSENGTPDTGTARQAPHSPTIVAEPETEFTTQASPTQAETQHTTQVSPTQAETESAATQVSPTQAETESAATQVSPTQAETEHTTQASPTQAETEPAATHPSAQLTAASSPAQPTATQPAAQPTAVHPSPDTTAVGTPAFPVPPAPSRRNRRSTALVAAGVALCALALAGTGYAVVNAGDDDGKQQNSATAGAGAASPDTKDASQNAEETAAPSTGAGGQDTSTSEGVQMQVTGSQTTYSGPCPPPSGEAPIFTASFTVDRLPAQFSYRWVSTDGTVTDEAWRTLSFPNGGSLTKQVSVSLTTWAKAGTFESEIGVELNAPLKGKSNMVPLSLTCEAGTTGGASHGQ